MVWRYTSPMLHDLGADMLHECPIGAVLREAPHTFQLIAAGAHADNAGVEMLEQPQYLQDAVALCGAERSRLRELADRDRQSESDARHGRNVLRGRG